MSNAFASHFFAYLSRLRLIRRWSLMRGREPENVQEHSHRVAVLAHCLAVIRIEVFGGAADPERAAFLALLHDAGEVITGDLPTPVKYHDAAIRAAYRGLEEAAAGRLLSLLPENFRRHYSPAFFPEDADAAEWRLVAAADRLCAWLKCVEERRGGNREFLAAEGAIRRRLEEMAVPEAEYFITHFAPGFSLTLDELEGGSRAGGGSGGSCGAEEKGQDLAMDDFTIIPKGVCCERIKVTLQGDLISSVEFEGGCDGNGKAISRLLNGLPVLKAAEILIGVDCDGKGTSCADQLARGIVRKLLKPGAEK